MINLFDFFENGIIGLCSILLVTLWEFLFDVKLAPKQEYIETSLLQDYKYEQTVKLKLFLALEH